MRMGLSADARAVEALPMRLLVVAVVAAMSVVPAAQALETLNDRDFLARAELAADKVVAAAQMLSMQGPGASKVLELDLSSDGGLRISVMTVGDALGGPRASAVVLELSSGARIVRSAEDPPVSMTTDQGSGLEVRSDRPLLWMEAVAQGDWCAVVVGVV